MRDGVIASVDYAYAAVLAAHSRDRDIVYVVMGGFVQVNARGCIYHGCSAYFIEVGIEQVDIVREFLHCQILDSDVRGIGYADAVRELGQENE